MMPTGYSTLFALGLSNVHSPVHCEINSGGLSPLPNSSLCTPLSSISASTASPDIASSAFELFVKPSKLNVDTQVASTTRTRIRRRRSSFSITANPAGIMKTPVGAKPAALVASNKIRGRRSDGDMIVTRNRRISATETLRSRRGAVVHTPAYAPPNAPLPPVPPLPTDENDASANFISVRPPTAAASCASGGVIHHHHRHALSEQEPLPQRLTARSFSFTAVQVPSPSLSTSPQTLLTPGFATKLVQALVTPPASPTMGPTSPVDPILGYGRSYFEPFTPADEAMTLVS